MAVLAADMAKGAVAGGLGRAVGGDTAAYLAPLPAMMGAARYSIRND